MRCSGFGSSNRDTTSMASLTSSRAKLTCIGLPRLSFKKAEKIPTKLDLSSQSKGQLSVSAPRPYGLVSHLPFSFEDCATPIC
jgi:hypothetical protein